LLLGNGQAGERALTQRPIFAPLYRVQVVPKKEVYTFKTQRKVPKTGLMLVGWGGNNGTTTTAGAPC